METRVRASKPNVLNIASKVRFLGSRGCDLLFGAQLETGVIPIDDTSDAPNGAFDD